MATTNTATRYTASQAADGAELPYSTIRVAVRVGTKARLYEAEVTDVINGDHIGRVVVGRTKRGSAVAVYMTESPYVVVMGSRGYGAGARYDDLVSMEVV